MWFLFAICSAFFAGVTAILAKIGIRNTDSTLATAIRTIVVLVFSWLLVIITGEWKDLELINWKILVMLILSGAATGASWICYFKALQLGDVNKVTPIDKSSTILTILLSFLILGETVSIFSIIGICAIGSGTFLMITKKEGSSIKTNENRWLYFALLSAIFASLTSILGKIGMQSINSNLGTSIRTMVVLLMAWIMVFLSKKQHDITKIDKKSWIFLIISGVTTGLSWLCYYKALQDGKASVVVPIDKLSIVVTIIFSYFFLKEKLTKKAGIGLVLNIIGTLVLLL